MDNKNKNSIFNFSYVAKQCKIELNLACIKYDKQYILHLTNYDEKNNDFNTHLNHCKHITDIRAYNLSEYDPHIDINLIFGTPKRWNFGEIYIIYSLFLFKLLFNFIL